MWISNKNGGARLEAFVALVEGAGARLIAWSGAPAPQPAPVHAPLTTFRRLLHAAGF
jgi:hypothetical protein